MPTSTINTNPAPFVIQPHLTAIAVAYQNGRMIADAVLPRVPVPGSTFKYTVYDKRDTFTIPDTKVGRTSRPNEVDWHATEQTASVKAYGLEEPIPQDDIDNAANTPVEDTVANAELQKQKLRDQQAEAEDKARYDAGLQTLAEYYNARAERINAEADAEQSILEKKLANEENAAAQLMGKSQDFIDQLIHQGPEAVEAAAGTNTQALAMLQKVAQTQAQMDEEEIKRQTKLQENETARHLAEIQANQRTLTDRQKLYELAGNTSAAQRLALERELQDTDALLTKLGVAEDQRAAILARAAANATARNQVGTLGQSGADEFTSLQAATGAIQDKANAGLISQVDAEAKIYALEAQRLPLLRSIANQMQDAVDNAAMQLLYLQPGTDDYNAQLQVVNNLERQVDQYTRNVDSLATSLHHAASFSVELTNQLTTQGTGAVVEFFDAWSQGSESFSSALADMGKTFERIITHMIDQMLVYYALMALVGWIAPNSGFYASLKASGPFSGLTGHAGGGYTGDQPTNRIAGFVHGKEFVFNAAATRKWGLPLLQAMNAATIGSVASSSTYSSLGSMSDGGGDSGPLVELNIDTNGQPAQTSRRTGAGGQSIIDVVIGQVASDIAGGGRVGQPGRPRLLRLRCDLRRPGMGSRWMPQTHKTN